MGGEYGITVNPEKAVRVNSVAVVLLAAATPAANHFRFRLVGLNDEYLEAVGPEPLR